MRIHLASTHVRRIRSVYSAISVYGVYPDTCGRSYPYIIVYADVVGSEPVFFRAKCNGRNAEKPFYPNLYGDVHLVGHQHGGRKPSETSVTEFFYKRVNLCLEEFKNNKIIFFVIQELFR